MIVKPKDTGVILLADGKLGRVGLHHNQKWKVKFLKNDDTKAEISRDSISLVVEMELLEKMFVLTH